MSTDVSDITLDQLIEEAIRKDRDALDKAVAHPEMAAILNEVAGKTAAKYRTATKYGLDADDIKQKLVVKMYESIDTIKNPEGREWRACLKSWLYSVAGNLSLSNDKHSKVEKGYVDYCISGESTCGKIKSTGDSSHNLQSSEAPAQEQAHLDKEREVLFRTAFKRLLRRFPRAKQVMKLWDEGRSVKEVAAITGLPIKAVYRLEGRFLKELVAEVHKLLDEKKDAT